jgi:hypothetical protein
MLILFDNGTPRYFDLTGKYLVSDGSVSLNPAGARAEAAAAFPE